MIFLQIYFNIFLFFLINYAYLLFFALSNKLGFFPKLGKNNITFIISDILIFRTNYTISKNTT